MLEVVKLPYTVAVSFEKFIENVSVSGNQSETAGNRCQSIVNLLDKEFTILEAFPIGSLISRTSLKGHADADIMLVLHFGKHFEGKSPSLVLQSVRDKLSEYNTRMAKKNGQAVTLYFKTWPNVDIVPACRVTDNGAFYCYKIPNMNDDSWIETRPKVHIQNMAGISSYKTNLIKMIKEWNRKHSSYLSSFHIEMMALSYEEFYDDYAWHTFKLFEHMYEKIQYKIPSPSGLGGYVDDYLSYSDRQEAKQRIETALGQSRNAWSDAFNNNDKASINGFGRLFGERYPTYG
ncbi:MAG: nucleotidyltransferase [gamma proteobacterium symbiont of Bathyaustriella thionipta]|nr:nucleotidyltransferase [gamma proteobacterium symbiont of Bathyaustriella thionipta]MCU7968390.1 nucleotidyltransferase [gamma proteobacterium symbiont of Bathyaustriella thionipta]